MATAVASAEPQSRRWRLRLPERLPNLKGRWLTLYTIVWAIFLPLSVVGAGRSAYIILTTPTMWSPYGFATDEDSRGLRVIAVLTPEVRAKGIAPDDIIVAIDGWTVPATAARAAARTHVVKPDGAATTFTVRKPSGRLAEIRLIRSQGFEYRRFREAGVNFTAARILSFAGSLLIPILFIPAAILQFIRRRREAVPACISLSFLILPAVMNGPDQLGISVGLSQAIAMLGFFLLLAALYAFPSGRFEPRWTAVPFLLLFPAVFVDSEWLGIVLVGSALAGLVSRYQKIEAGSERLQLRWAFFGMAIGLLLLGVNLMAGAASAAYAARDPRWLAWEYALINPSFDLAFCIMALGLIVSILRYRLYDADAVIGRSAAYAMLTVAFVVLFAGSQKVIELLGQEYLGQNVGGLAGGIGAALAAVAIAPMHNRSQRWAERRFQKSLYRLRNGLPALVGDLRETAGLEQIAGATLDSVVEGVRAQRAAIIARDELIDAREISPKDLDTWRRNWAPSVRDGIDWNASDPILPVRVPLEAEGHGRVGWLLLGPRPDGSLFGKAEYDAIEEIAEPVARAVQVALGRQEREARYEGLFRSLQERLAKLEARTVPSAG